MGKNKNRNSRMQKAAKTREEMEEAVGAEEKKMMEGLKSSALRPVKQKKAKQRQPESSEDELDSEAEKEAEVLRSIKADKGEVSQVTSRPFVNNKDAMKERLEDMKTNLPFEETLQIVAEKELDIDDIEDDLKREVGFYNQALAAVKGARAQLDKANTPHMRPFDYFADMVKSDKHMGRVKQHLLFEKQKMEGFERRKQQKEFKKYSKQLQAEKQKEKAKQKKNVKEVAKQFKGKTPDSLATLGGSKKRSRNDSRPEKSAKRLAKDRKYGSGYVKGSKKNTSQSSRDVSGFNSKKNKAPFPGMKGKKRPGKARRQNRRTG